MLTPDSEEKLGLDTDVVKDDDGDWRVKMSELGRERRRWGTRGRKEEKACKRPQPFFLHSLITVGKNGYGCSHRVGSKEEDEKECDKLHCTCRLRKKFMSHE